MGNECEHWKRHVARNISDADTAKAHCEKLGVRYLSHESQWTLRAHEILIAVEDGPERYEVRLSL
jgi:hypothetical protein